MIGEHGDWRCVEHDERDSGGFTTPGWDAVHRTTGEVRLIQHSRFRFTMTPERFAFLADRGIPGHPGHPGYWTDKNIDAAMRAAA